MTELDQNTHRALVDAGLAPLGPYVARYGAIAPEPEPTDDKPYPARVIGAVWSAIVIACLTIWGAALFVARWL